MSRIGAVASALSKLTFSEMILLAESIQDTLAEVPTGNMMRDSRERLATALSQWAEQYDQANEV